MPHAIRQYLDKQIQLGAILGPFQEVKCQHFYCSHLLTRPKDDNKRRVILDLSSPAGASDNNAVTRDKFDGSSFTFKFLTVDDIVDDIRQRKGIVVLAKIDVTRTFGNLRVDPANAFKFNLKWDYQYYLDVAIAFGWVQGSVSFQMTSNAILHIHEKSQLCNFCLH